MYDTLDEIKTVVFETFSILADYTHAECYKVKILFNARYTRCLGRASGHRLQLSSKFWPHISDELKHDIIVHEACHVVQSWTYPFSEPHGKEWRKLMRLMGKNPKVNQEIPEEISKKVKPKSQHRKQVFCGCKEGCMVGPRQYKYIANDTHRYRCRVCNTRLSIHRLPKLVGGGIWDDVQKDLEKMLNANMEETK